MDDIFDSIPDDLDNVFKRVLNQSINEYINKNRIKLSTQEIIEYSILKKILINKSLTEIFDLINFSVDEETDVVLMNFSEELKLCVDTEYNKYIKNL